MTDTDEVSALIFDLGGTLNTPSFTGAEFIRHLLRMLIPAESKPYSDAQLLEIQRAPRAWLEHYMTHNNVPPHWQMSLQEATAYWRMLLDAIGSKADATRIAMAYLDQFEFLVERMGAKIVEHCKEVLHDLQSRGYSLGLASNRWTNPLPYLKRNGIADLFEAVEFTLVPGYKKPSPYMLLKVAEELRTNPRRCAYIGDSRRFDVLAAERAEMLPVLIVHDAPKNGRLLQNGVAILSSLRSLLDLFKFSS